MLDRVLGQTNLYGMPITYKLRDFAQLFWARPSPTKKLPLLLDLALRPNFMALALELSGIEKLARFFLFGRYIDPGSAHQVTLTNGDSWCSTWTLDLVSFTSTEASLCTPVQPLFERILCSPASSAPIEKVLVLTGAPSSSHST